MMAIKFRSSEAERQAYQTLMNEQRLKAWRERWALATGREPVYVINPPTTPEQRLMLAQMQSTAIATNTNVLKMPLRKRQYMGADLPQHPDPAA